MRMQRVERTEFAVARQVDCEHEVWQAPALRSRLEHPSGSAEGFRQREALRDVLGAGFLAVDILARLGGQRGGRGVPVRTGGNQHGIQIVAGQEFAQVAVQWRNPGCRICCPPFS
jgi:hypothetical protein